MITQIPGFRTLSSIFACYMVMAVCPSRAAEVATADANLRQRTLLDPDWLFHRGDVSDHTQASAATADDSSWERVQLPHDYVLDGTPRLPDPSTDPAKLRVIRNHAYIPIEVAWYRRHFSIPETARGRILQLDFGAVGHDSEVWLNGNRLGRHRNGYTPFSYDITALARIGADNVIAVRVDPREPEG
jgi:beta-galactosidase